jgi:hypothetical protein
MAQKKTIAEILVLDCPDLVNELYEFVSEKHRTGQTLLPIEEETYLALSMLADIEMEGFVDLFHQFYTLRETDVVEGFLQKLELKRLAKLFAEARSIFTNSRVELTEEEYKEINPFDHDARWQRFDKIGNEILAEGSEVFLIGDRVCAYVRAHLNEFQLRGD